MNVRPTIDRGAASRRDDQRILAVASGKGGVGKTWLSITLAQAFARRGKRVLVFDGDLGLANIDIQLGLMPETDLQAVFDGRAGLKAAVMPYRQGGFDLIAGRSGSGGLASLPMERLEALCERLVVLAEDYDHVLIDLGAGVEKSVRQLARPASKAARQDAPGPNVVFDSVGIDSVDAFVENPEIVTRPNRSSKIDFPGEERRKVIREQRVLAET